MHFENFQRNILTALDRPLSKKIYFLAVFCLFFFGWIVGGTIGAMNNSYANSTINGYTAGLDFSENQSSMSMAQDIFYNNVEVAIVNFAGSILIFPMIISMLLNGGMVGLVFAWAYHSYGVLGILVVLLGILPHGIFEVPATVLSAAMGLRILHTAILVSRKKLEAVVAGKIVMNSVVVFVFFCIPTLFLAALIESYFTTWLLSLVALV